MIPAIILLLLALVFGPMLYVRWVMARHASERTDLPGTGGELARHLLDEAGLHHVLVEPTDQGDHYDPATPAVRLSPEYHDGRSITAVAVAAHEVAHAVQDRDNDPVFRLRMVLMRALAPLRLAVVALLTVVPLLGGLAGAGHLVVPSIGLAMALFGLSVVAQLATLPLEIDASFRRALPALRQGGYLDPRDLPGASAVLRAAALTYVAAVLMSLLQLARVVR